MILARALLIVLALGVVCVWLLRMRGVRHALAHRPAPLLPALPWQPAPRLSDRVVRLAEDPAQYHAAIRAYCAETGLDREAATEVVHALIRRSRYERR